MTSTGLSRSLLAKNARAKHAAAKRQATANGRFSAARARRCVQRERLGALRDRQIREGTKKRYLIHMRAFFTWMEKTGRSYPARCEAMDQICCAWAEHLWHEGDAKSILSNSLCGLTFFCEGLRGKLHGSWKLFKAWGKSEVVHRAPPLPMLFAQALAGEFARQGFCSAAVLILVAHHCMLRTCEMLSLRTGDFADGKDGIMLTLRETKMGQRVGIHQQTTVVDPWLVSRLRRAIHATPIGQLLIGMTPARFRALWSISRTQTGVPRRYTPYSLRRGGATAMFSCCGSFDKVADTGRWASISACRLYITTGLQELAGADELDLLAQTMAKHVRYLSILDW